MTSVQHAGAEYRVERATFGAGFAIVRRDDDGRSRTVAHIERRGQFDTFRAALDAGADELAAVRAIDAEEASR